MSRPEDAVNRFNNAEGPGDLSPEDAEMLKRVAHDCRMVADGYDLGLRDGKARGLKAAAEHLEAQADLCDRGIAPSADLMRMVAAVFRAEGAQLEELE